MGWGWGFHNSFEDNYMRVENYFTGFSLKAERAHSRGRRQGVSRHSQREKIHEVIVSIKIAISRKEGQYRKHHFLFPIIKRFQ